jgi:hypothetical protein
MGQRTIRLDVVDNVPKTPEALAAEGHGEVRDLWDANKTWLTPGIFDYPGRGSAFPRWNPGQQMIVPPNWRSLVGEFEGPKL